jgi:hypothetical protein
MRKLVISSSIFGLLLFFMGQVHAERSRSALCEPRVPALNIDQAIQLAKNSHRAHSDKKIFIDEAILKCENNIHTWHIGYRLKAYESGHSIVKVLMDGTVKSGKVIKDG